LFIAIADVDALVDAQSNIDNHASKNTTSVYTVAQIFPMLPEKLSTDLTSLRFNEDRCAIVVEMVVGDEGAVEQSDVYSAIVLNRAKLDYMSLGSWLEGTGPIPSEITKVEGLAENIKLQDRVAQKMKELRYVHGALNFDTIEARPVFDGDALSEMKVEQKNRAKDLIEDFMIASNGATARFLSGKQFPSLRRVVRIPKQWDRIVELASSMVFRCQQRLIPNPFLNTLSFSTKKIRFISRICRLAFLNSWVLVNMYWKHPVPVRKVIWTGSKKIIHILLLQTGVSRSGHTAFAKIGYFG